MRVLLDSNIVMYAAGQPHPSKEPSLAFLGRAHSGEIQAVTSTEVLQELLRGYRRLGRPEVAREVYALTLQVCREVFPVTVADTDACLELLQGSGTSVPDALHAGVMRNNEVEFVASYDAQLATFGVRMWPLG